MPVMNFDLEDGLPPVSFSLNANDAERFVAFMAECDAALKAAAAPTAKVARTPAARWAANGEPDPHGDSYDCERADLTMGNLTDDELANAAFMNYDSRPSIEDIMAGKAHMPIAYMTAVKERIRWLSRALVKATAAPAAVPEGWRLVPIEPTESMVIAGFESVPSPNPTFTPMAVWDEYEAMSGCQQAAFRAKLCWAAMLAAAPETWKELPSQAEPTGEPKQEPVSPYTNKNEGSAS